MEFVSIFNNFKEQSIAGRYIHLKHIEPLLLHHNRKRNTTIIGHSVLGKPIYKYVIGSGKIKVLMWSQMHGNESTTTKAVFDLFNFLDSEHNFATFIKNTYTICIVPILNPDGAEMYQRENANAIDLNRDAQDLSQPESRVLRNLFQEFIPNYCYNLHDQRTIYGVGDTNLPATVSFLAPAFNEAREFDQSRNTAISVICHLNKVLQNYIPGQVGRYDDAFNANCVGDTFQMLGVPTILFEAGHYQNDYQREQTRKFIFIALLSSFDAMSENLSVDNIFNDYLSIPLNKTSFLDIIYKNIRINYDNTILSLSFAAQFNEKIVNFDVEFSAIIEKIDNLENVIGHREYDLENAFLDKNFINAIKIGQIASFELNNGIKFVNGLMIL